MKLSSVGALILLVTSVVPERAHAGSANVHPASVQDEVVNWETPHVHPLALTPNGNLLLAVNTPDNRLLAFTFAGTTPVLSGSTLVGLEPISVRVRNNGEAWIVNHVSDSISVVNLVTGHVRATLATDDEPCDVVFAGAPKRAFVTCSQTNTVLVFDPLNLDAPPTRIALRGEDPRSLAVSPSGDRVYAAIFESGNETTILAGGTQNTGLLPYPPIIVSDPLGPYGGVNPPPNSGAAFDPPIDPLLPPPPAVGLIVRRDSAGRWMDDNAHDWTDFVDGPEAARSGRPVGWTLLDHDVAIIEAGTLAVSYADHLMNLNMALAVNPVTGEVSVVGTDATNEIRYAPKVNGTFVRSHFAQFHPTASETVTIADLNGHVTYTAPTIPQTERDMSIGDPRGIVWNTAGTLAYVTGMGSNNVVVVGPGGERAGIAATIEVGEGPTGIEFDENRGQVYVLNKFEASVSVVDVATELEVARVSFFDPSPAVIRAGRRHMYDTHETSGTGIVSCASCHVDSRMDRLSWDLGNPAGAMKLVEPDQNMGAGVQGLGAGSDYQDWHPMKGPMLTQTLQDIIGHEPHHWRGDRDGIEEFNPAFEDLMGDDEQLDPAEMQEFEDFLATIAYPPNPFRNLDNSLSTDLPLTGHYSAGVFSPAGSSMPNGNAVNGLALFRPPNMLDGTACISCHTRPTGGTTGHTWVGSGFVPFPVGPNGEQHQAILQIPASTNEVLKVPQLRNLYERTGFDNTQLESTAGFGFLHDGNVDSLLRFITEPSTRISNDQQASDILAFVLSFSGDSESMGSTVAPLEPIGLPGQGTHAAVGKQVTLRNASPSPAALALLDLLVAEADLGRIGLIARGWFGGGPRGAYYLGDDLFQTDRRAERVSLATLMGTAMPGTEVTFTAVPKASERRMGVDQDADSAYDRDEFDLGTDPADPASRPKLKTH